jgi:hypothetical protein
MTTLATLQTEREKLRALAAREDFDAALADTCDATAVLAAAQATSRLLLAELGRLGQQMQQAVGGETDETRVHYLMSDAAHDWLARLGPKVEKAAAALPVAAESMRRGMKPRDLLTVSQWADRNRWLKSGTNSPGPWRTNTTPYLREIMDALSEHSAVRQVTFIKSSGVGGPLALDTPIATPTGWTSMGEIQPGDTVFDERGQPCRVTYVSPVFTERDCVEMVFSDGAVIVCDTEHRWTVSDRSSGASLVKTTAEIRDSLRHQDKWRYAISVNLPLACDEVVLPIPPYVLGYWLANGAVNENRCVAHTDDADEIAGYLTSPGWPARVQRPSHIRGRAAIISMDTPPRDSGLCAMTG